MWDSVRTFECHPSLLFVWTSKMGRNKRVRHTVAWTSSDSIVGDGKSNVVGRRGIEIGIRT